MSYELFTLGTAPPPPSKVDQKKMLTQPPGGHAGPYSVALLTSRRPGTLAPPWVSSAAGIMDTKEWCAWSKFKVGAPADYQMHVHDVNK